MPKDIKSNRTTKLCASAGEDNTIIDSDIKYTLPTSGLVGEYYYFPIINVYAISPNTEVTKKGNFVLSGTISNVSNESGCITSITNMSLLSQAIVVGCTISNTVKDSVYMRAN